MVSQSKNGFPKYGSQSKNGFPKYGSQSKNGFPKNGSHSVVLNHFMVLISWFPSRGFHHIYKNIMIYMFFQTYESLVRLNFYMTSCHSCGGVVKNVYCSIQNSKTKQMYTTVYKIRRLSKCILQYTKFED